MRARDFGDRFTLDYELHNFRLLQYSEPWFPQIADKDKWEILSHRFN